jgi:hypothetical protein
MNKVDAAYDDGILDTSWGLFKVMCKEYIDALPTLDIGGLLHGRKVIGIAYLSLKNMTPAEAIQAPILIQIVMRESMNFEWQFEDSDNKIKVSHSF